MIKLFRWHHTHFQPPIETDETILSEISFGVDDHNKYVTIDPTQVIIGNKINIKDGVKFSIGYHASQKNLYLAMTNINLEASWILLQSKNRYDQELFITVVPSRLNNMALLGKSIALEMTKISTVVCSANLMPGVTFELAVDGWRTNPPMKLNITELLDFMSLDND
jgi:hypothetical protein